MASRSKMLLNFFPAVFIIGLLLPNRVSAQEDSSTSEPAIPVYFIYPNHEDSLKGAPESSILTNGTSLAYFLKKYDSLQFQLQKSSEESSTRFNWLYTIVGVLILMNIVLLIFIFRIRKELSKVKQR